MPCCSSTPYEGSGEFQPISVPRTVIVYYAMGPNGEKVSFSTPDEASDHIVDKVGWWTRTVYEPSP